MLATLAFVVVFSSILVFFSNELKETGKKMLTNTWFQVLVPLFLGSWILVENQQTVLWFLVTVRIGLFYISNFFSSLFPFLHNSIAVGRILSLILLSTGLIAVADLVTKWRRPTINLRFWAEWISLFVWIICAFLYAVGFPGFEV
ncbi:MAG: hypothetical protein Q8R24_09870 [Legionellaceae bacterium]|nr:hypothetical protein [Legionellaceae bacterium]